MGTGSFCGDAATGLLGEAVSCGDNTPTDDLEDLELVSMRQNS